MPRPFSVLLTLVCTLLGTVPVLVGAAAEADDEGARVGAQIITGEQPNDIIARVGDQPISFNQIEIMLNSSAVIGMNIPPPGTPERNRVRIELLDKIVSANLLYLDALDKGVEKAPVYQHEVERFAESTLVTMYRQKVLIGDLPVSDEEIMAYYENNIVDDTPFTKDLGTAIEAKLHKQKYQVRIADLRERLREGISVSIDEAQLDPAQDGDRKSDTVVARVDQEAVTWGEVRGHLSNPKGDASVENRIAVLNDFIDRRIMLQKARAANLKDDPKFQERFNEFRKLRLIAMHRGQLVEELEPTDDEIRAYYKEHRDRIHVPEMRNVQMVVMPVKEDAERVKQQIESGEITMFEAAQEFSIDPNAKKTLGELGWVEQGSGFPELDELTFSLAPNTIGGPVESPAGWHLVRVLEVREAANTNISEADTWRKTRRMMIKERMNEYTTDLRNNKYTVEVYSDVLNRLLEEEMGKGAPQPEAAPQAQQGAS
jgi:peptidyl-prolyl cis-trans isomerase C